MREYRKRTNKEMERRMKLLLYCTKAKPYLIQGFARPYHTKDTSNPFNYNWGLKDYKSQNALNGKIVAECDFRIEEIKRINTIGDWYFYENQDEILEKSCIVDINKFFDYFNGKNGYAIHIKNLHIFDKPKELNDYITKQCQFGKCSTCEYGKKEVHCGTIDTPITKAPQNMMYCYEDGEMKVLISIRPEWLCKILNGEKTIECRKRILKEMLNDK